MTCEGAFINLSSTLECTNMRKRDLISRYRAAKKTVDEQAYADGAKAGREWATDADSLPYEELSKLAGNRAMLSDSYDDMCFITSLFVGDHGVISAFWESAVGDEWLEYVFNPEFLRGFCEGALEVWDEVSPHLV
jgi:hypothetical protein